MRKRFQKGSRQKVRGEWVARWRQDGQRKARILGRISQMTKTEAQSELAALVAPVNSKRKEPSEQTSFGDFIRDVYLPFYKRKWKRSTTMTNEDRLAAKSSDAPNGRKVRTIAGANRESQLLDSLKSRITKRPPGTRAPEPARMTLSYSGTRVRAKVEMMPFNLCRN